MSKKYINIHSVRYHRPAEHCSSQQNQQDSKPFTRTHTHACHAHGTRRHTRTSQRERSKDKPPTLEKTRAPSHHGAEVGAGQMAEGHKGRQHKPRPPKKHCIPRPLHPQPPTNKGKFLCDMDDQRCVIIIILN